MFQAINCQDFSREDRGKGNIKRKTESILIAAQNISIKTNYIKANTIILTRIAREGFVEKEIKRLIT